MIVLCDTRQQAGKHGNIDAYFAKTGIKMDRCALYVGDYALAHDGGRVVDTKQDVIELIHDVMTSDHERFRRECERAQEAGIRLLVLTEETLPEGGLSAWQSPKKRDGKKLTAVNGETLRRALLTMTVKYGVRFRFCDANSTGRIIAEYLADGTLP